MNTRKLIFFLMMGITLGFLSGCNFLNEDDNRDSLQDVWAGFGLIQKDTASDSFTIELDNGAVLIPSNVSYWKDDVHDKQRVLANFTMLGDQQSPDSTKQYDVKLNSLRNILYKGILNITPATEDSIGHDPIYVKDHWLHKNMLNFELQYLGGSKIHYINLVKQPNASATEPVVLELRHNNNDDLERINMSAVVTFDLSSLKVPGKDSVTFKVVAKGFNDYNFEYTGVYKY